MVVRGEYDRSTILASYDWETGESTSDFIQDLVDTPPQTSLLAPESIPEPVVPSDVAKTASPTPAEAPKDPKRSLYVTHTVSR